MQGTTLLPLTPNKEKLPFLSFKVGKFWNLEKRIGYVLKNNKPPKNCHHQTHHVLANTVFFHPDQIYQNECGSASVSSTYTYSQVNTRALKQHDNPPWEVPTFSTIFIFCHYSCRFGSTKSLSKHTSAKPADVFGFPILPAKSDLSQHQLSNLKYKQHKEL